MSVQEVNACWETASKRSGSNSRQQQITHKDGGVSVTTGAAFIYSSALPGKCGVRREKNSGFNVLFKCIKPKVEPFGGLLNVTK